MKICVHLRDDPPANLRLSNLRSEGRWEREVFEAVLQNPLVTDVFSSGYRWPGQHEKYRGRIKNETSRGCILLMQDWNLSVLEDRKFAGVFVNIFAGPWLEQIPEIKAKYQEYGGKLFFTMGFPIIFREEFERVARTDGPEPEKKSHLEQFLPRDNIFLLPVPGAPYVRETSNFDKKKLLLGQRLIFINQLETIKTLFWSLEKLQQDPSLHLDILTGWKAEEVKDYVDAQVVYRDDIWKYFWENPAFTAYRDVANRVNIHLELDWETTLGLYSEAKLLVTYGKLFGGPPIEAGMHGVPFVGTAKTGALGDCSLYQYAENEDEACRLLDKLHSDEEHYNRIGSSYRRYVETHYTYEAFNDTLNNLIRSVRLL